jgi:hypothetical protein
MEARGAAGSAATRRCVRRPRLQRARCDFVDFFRCTPRDLGPIGHGAPPQAHIHLNLEVYISGSPRTKFGVFVTVCNRRFHMLDHLFGASLRVRNVHHQKIIRERASRSRFSDRSVRAERARGVTNYDAGLRTWISMHLRATQRVMQ